MKLSITTGLSLPRYILQQLKETFIPIVFLFNAKSGPAGNPLALRLVNSPMYIGGSLGSTSEITERMANCDLVQSGWHPLYALTLAYASVLSVSSSMPWLGVMLRMIVVKAFPPRLSASTRVSLDSR